MKAASTKKKDILFLKTLKPTQIFIYDKGGLSFKNRRAGKGYLTGWKYKGTAFLNIMQFKRYTVVSILV